MKLNPDCIRDILVLVEEETTLHRSIQFFPDDTNPGLNYPFEEIIYHVKQCELSGLFGNKVTWTISGACIVPYLSPRGHQLLSEIRENNVWNKTKSILYSIGSVSIGVMQQIASEVTAAFIQQKLGLK